MMFSFIFFVLQSSSISFLSSVFVQLLGIIQTKYLIGLALVVGEIYEKHSLHSYFLKSKEIPINGITSPVGFSDENLSTSSFWGFSACWGVGKWKYGKVHWNFFFLFEAMLTQDISNQILNTVFSWCYMTMRLGKNHH